MWDWFINLLTQILAGLQGLVGDWGLAVIVLTIIIRLLLTPLMTKSAASNARMQVMQPKLQEMQEKYADDPERLNEEMRKFYAEEKYNPFTGCLPVLLQMPIFFALFSVIKNVPSDASFYGVLPSLASSCSDMLSTYGFVGAWAYLLFDALFGVLTFVPMIMNLQNQDEAARKQSLIMGVVMAVMMLWFGWSVPAAVLLYYDASAIWQVFQQRFVTQRVIENEKAKMAEREAARGVVEVDVVRKEKKARPRKKG